MDLPSLLAWRSSCTTNYAHATAALKRTLTSMINPFLSHPTALLEIITRHGAVIGGEVALAFVRRHRPFQPRTLEIFASISLYGTLCDELASDPRIRRDITEVVHTASKYPFNLQRDILETTQIHLRTGRTIHIRCSATLSPLSPIARSLCTAMANFVTAHSFGCAYPRLTFDNKALLSDLRRESMVDFDAGVMQTLAEQQIELEIDPANWRQYRLWSTNPTVTNAHRACWRSHYICPEQGRFFGDRGSLVDFVDPLQTPATTLREQGSPPFGTTVLWRLSSSYRCPLSCESHDSNLPIGQTSTAVILMDDPFTKPDRGRRITRTDRVNNRYTMYPPHGRQSRSASL